MIQFKADTRSACAMTDDAITTGSVGIPVELSLAPEFSGLAKTLVFTNGKATVDVVLVGDAASSTVPPDVLNTPGAVLQIGIYAADASGNIVIPTIFAYVAQIQQGAVPSGYDPAAPTPPWAVQVQQIAEAAAQSAEADALKSEGYAVGTQDGEPVGPSSPYHENNAAYYADMAEQAAGQAGYMFFYIDENGDLIYQRTPNVQVDFYLEDGDLYVREAV